METVNVGESRGGFDPLATTITSPIAGTGVALPRATKELARRLVRLAGGLIRLSPSPAAVSHGRCMTPPESKARVFFRDGWFTLS
jgi:hypothetical protein